MLQNWLNKAKYPVPPPGLPDPNQIEDPALAEEQDLINKEITATTPSTRKRKRGNYNYYDDETRCKIAKYASLHGNTAAARHFSTYLGKKISECTVRNYKKKLTNQIQRTKQPINSLPSNKRGRPPILGEELDNKVQDALKRIRQDGVTINRHIVIATGTAIVRHYKPSLLKDHGGPLQLTRYWAESLM